MRWRQVERGWWISGKPQRWSIVREREGWAVYSCEDSPHVSVRDAAIVLSSGFTPVALHQSLVNAKRWARLHS